MTEKSAEALASEAIGAAGSTAGVRDEARGATIAMLRLIEKRLLDGLEGARLRGIPNLMPEVVSAPFHATRVRGRNLNEPLPFDGRGVLVLTAHGQFCVARRDLEGYDGITVRVNARPAVDEDFVAQDVAEIASNVAHVLKRHVAQCGSASGNYARLRDVALAVMRGLSTGDDRARA